MVNSRYDMLVLDLDGTLLNRKGRVSDANRDAVCRARDAGLQVLIATGRALVESQGPLRQIDHQDLIVAAGGSLLCDVATGRTLDRQIMPDRLVGDVTNVLLEYDHKVLVLKDADRSGYDYLAVGGGDLDPASEWWFEAMSSTVRFVTDLADDPHPDDTLRIGVVATGGELVPIARRLRSELGDRVFLQHWPAVTSTHAVGSATHLLEIFNPQVNKWTMIESHARREGMTPPRIAAIGDGLNDVELIRECGLGIAMGNAGASVMDVADQVTADHDEDGVAVAIDRILEGIW